MHIKEVPKFFEKIGSDVKAISKANNSECKDKLTTSVALRVFGVILALAAVATGITALTAIIALNPVGATVLTLTTVVLAVFSYMSIKKGNDIRPNYNVKIVPAAVNALHDGFNKFKTEILRI